MFKSGKFGNVEFIAGWGKALRAKKYLKRRFMPQLSTNVEKAPKVIRFEDEGSTVAERV